MGNSPSFFISWRPTMAACRRRPIWPNSSSEDCDFKSFALSQKFRPPHGMNRAAMKTPPSSIRRTVTDVNAQLNEFVERERALTREIVDLEGAAPQRPAPNVKAQAQALITGEPIEVLAP